MHFPENVFNKKLGALPCPHVRIRTDPLPLLSADVINVQGIYIRPFPGLVNVVPAVAYLFCLNLPAAFSQPGMEP